MKIIEAAIYALKIPFVESFSHAAKTRVCSDSIVVRLLAEDGTAGYGEGVPRPYVTGETVESCFEAMKDRFWPAVRRADYPALTSLGALRPIQESFAGIKTVAVQPPPFVKGDRGGFETKFRDVVNRQISPIPSLRKRGTERLLKTQGVIAWNAARTAFELALIDCLLKQQHLSLSKILLPKRDAVIYSGVITSGSREKMVGLARRLKSFGIRQIKVKIDGQDDRAKLLAIREVVGDEASLRVDANGAFDFRQAVSVLSDIAEAKIDCVEQPLPRGKASELALFKAEVSIPIMVDESLVTIEDAEALIAAKACDLFNLRISKCGGIGLTLKLARMATEAGIKLQLGAQVGETAILSAAGRHVAAHLDGPEFVEGSFGTMLLTEDVAAESVNFGRGGSAPLLRGEGLGIHVCDEMLKKCAVQVIECGRNL